jgi:hypothetical protein
MPDQPGDGKPAQSPFLSARPVNRLPGRFALRNLTSVLGRRRRGSFPEQGLRLLHHIIRPPKGHLESAGFIFPKDYRKLLVPEPDKGALDERPDLGDGPAQSLVADFLERTETGFILEPEPHQLSSSALACGIQAAADQERPAVNLNRLEFPDRSTRPARFSVTGRVGTNQFREFPEFR